jgi:hypothetical protein
VALSQQLSKSCQKVVRKLSESCQKVVKKNRVGEEEGGEEGDL